MSTDIRALLEQWNAGAEPTRDDLRAAVKQSLAQLVERAPGRSVEVRVPPFAAVQVIEGVHHRRGTPAAVVETDPRTWLELACGQTTWESAKARGKLSASGERADLRPYLPLDLTPETASE